MSDGWTNYDWRNGRTDGGMDGQVEGCWDEWGESHLEIICNKAVDDRIHTAIQTAESDSQVVGYDMMRHVRVEVHHHLQHNMTTHTML